MSYLNDGTPSISKELIDKVVKELGELPSKEVQTIKQYLRTRSIKQANIRDHILVEEVQLDSPTAVLIVDGAISLTRKVGKQDQRRRDVVQLAQLSGMQFTGVESIINNNVVKYTVTARSGFVHYMEIKEAAMVQLIFRSLKEIILHRQLKRDVQFKKRQAQAMKKLSEELKKGVIDRISLPNIKLFQNEQKRGENNRSMKRLQNLSNESSPRQVDNKRSLRILQKYTPDPPNQQAFALKIHRKKIRGHTETTKAGDSKEERSEKLFKEQLKHIIKRKLIYERKQLGVLKAFRQNAEGEVVNYKARPGISHEGTEIDQYFHM